MAVKPSLVYILFHFDIQLTFYNHQLNSRCWPKMSSKKKHLCESCGHELFSKVIKLINNNYLREMFHGLGGKLVQYWQNLLIHLDTLLQSTLASN